MNFIKKRNLPELLAPAGSFEHLKAAVAAGAEVQLYWKNWEHPELFRQENYLWQK